MGNISVISAGGTTATIGGDCFDKHTVYSNYSILSNASASADKFYTYSLSSYLPADSSTHDYEVLFEGYGASGSSSGNTIVYRLCSGTVTSADNYSSYVLGSCQARTAASVVMGGSAWVPIYSSDRNVTFWNSGTASSSLYLRAVCYRRLGRNTDDIYASEATYKSALGSRAWYAIAYGNSKFVALSYSGYISNSSDGTTWTTATQNANLGNKYWYDLAYGNNKFVALGQNGYISTSTDGITWTTATQNANLGNNHWESIAYGNGNFVALSTGGYISTSTNGTTWTTATQNANLGSHTWCAIAYGNNNKFVALSETGYISTSTNGITWTTATQNANLGNNYWESIAYGNNKFVALGQNGYISTSTDGTTWITATYNANLGKNTWHAIAYGNNNKFVALGGTGGVSILGPYIKQITAGGSTNTIGGYKYTGSVNLFSSPRMLWSGSLATDTGTYVTPLTNDYDYEIIVGGKGSTPATTGKFVSMTFNEGSSYSQTKQAMLFRRVSRTAAEYYDSGTITIPISKSSPYLYIYNPSGATLSNAAVYLYGYRRLPIDPTGNVVSNINGIYFGGTNFDGEIVSKVTSFISNEALTVNSRVYTYSLSSYLPNDSNSYIVSFSGWIRSYTGNSQIEAYILGGTKTTSQMTSNGFQFAQTDYHSTSNYASARTVKVYIPANDRNVTFFIKNKSTATTTGQCALFAVSYRRVGSNS